MGDIKEPTSLLIKRIENKIAEFRYNLSRMALRQEELRHEMEVISANEQATLEALKSQEMQLKEFNL